MRLTIKRHPSSILLFSCWAVLCFMHLAGSNWCFGLTEPILYVDDSSNRLGTINLRTHETAVIGAFNVPSVLTDIAFSPSGEHLFGVSPDGLWQINPETAATQFVGGFGIFGLLMNALVFDTDGRLYAAAANSTLLYEVNPTTGFVVRAVDMGGFFSSGDLVFDDARNLYLSGNDSNLVAIDRGTGLGTQIGPFGFPDVLGLAHEPFGAVYGFSGTNVFTVNLNTGNGSFLLNYGSSGLTEAFGGSFRNEIVPSGDFDLDEDVDGSDFLLWQRTFGSTTELAADGNGDGVVDSGDLALWQAQFGLNEGPGPLVAAVPEPPSLAAAVCLVLTLTPLLRAAAP